MNDMVLKCDEPDCSERTLLTDQNVHENNPFENGWKEYAIFIGAVFCYSVLAAGVQINFTDAHDAECGTN